MFASSKDFISFGTIFFWWT